MDLSRAMHPLSAVLRAAFALVVVAALVVDAWANTSLGLRTPATAVVLVALLGIGWAYRPTTTTTAVVAVVASVVSLLATASAPQNGSRFAFFTEFVVLPVLFGAVLAGIARWRWPMALLVAVAAESIALRAQGGPIRWIVATSMLVLLGAAGTAVVYMRLRDQERRTSIEMARQSERLDLARELHDVVGHHVTGIVVLAQASKFSAAGVGGTGGAIADIERTFTEIEAAGLETLTSVRRVVGLLRADPSISSGPTLADVEHLVDDLRRTHPDTDLVVDPIIRARWVPADLATTVHRLVQEATTNVRKHGDPAAPVRFRLGRTATSIALSVENGVSPARPTGLGYGLDGMRERVDALGGTFAAGPDGAGGWTVRATLPLTDPDRR